jgi:glycine/serine hydroxymethyltransferase
MALIAKMILDVFQNIDNQDIIQKVNDQARALCEAFPIYKTQGSRVLVK